MPRVASCSKDSETSSNQALTINKKYQKASSKLLFIRGYSRPLKEFQLESNVVDVHVVNDVIFDEGRDSNYFMKFNCFEDKEKKIAAVDLLAVKNGAFSLLKYIFAYKKLKTEGRYKDAFIKSLIVFTNIPFDFEKGTNIIIDSQIQEKIEFQEIPLDESNFLHLKIDKFEVKFYRTVDPKIIKILKDKAIELTETDITEALNKLMFVVAPSDVTEFQKSVEHQIGIDLKAQVSERALINLDELIFNFLKNNEVLTYKQAKLFVKKNIKKGVEGLHGHMYAVSLIMLLFWRAYSNKIVSFSLETEVEEAAKFDDIVYCTKTKNNSLEYRFIQLKHKKNNNYKITDTDLFSKLNGDFNLIKYVCSYWIIKNNPDYNQCLIKDTIVFTNSSFSSDKIFINLESINKGTSNNLKRMKFEDIEISLKEVFIQHDDILKFPNVKYYKFEDPNTVKILLEQKNTKLQREKENKINKSKDSKSNDESEEKKQMQKALESLNKQSIEEALNHIMFAVNQPNEDEMFGIIENEIKERFNLHSHQTFRKLQTELIKWVKGKSIIPPEIQFSDIDKFFQNNAKNFTFEIPSTTQSFIGRQEQLKEIRKKLSLENSIAISQSNTVGISGLGGIGKSELAKQFIKRFKDKDYYGRVIWIDAENQSSIKMKMKCIISDLNIEMPDQTSLPEEEQTKQKIRKILDFFKDMKILFVFDNVEKREGSFDCLTYFRQVISTMSNKPHILITTRNSKYGGKNISHINLELLSKKEAIEMVEQHLLNFLMTNEEKKVKKKKTNEEVEQLTNLLHCFPLAMKQATAYILKEHEAAKNIGSKYTITQYIQSYNKKTEELLNFKFDDDCGNEYSQTTFMTWNVTIDAIKKQKYGKDAIRILELVAYFEADYIDLDLLKPLLEYPENIGHAIQILKTYSLINQTEAETPVYNIHRLVQKVTRIKNKNDDKHISLLKELLKAIRNDKEHWKSIFKPDPVDRILRFALKYDEVINEWYKEDFRASSVFTTKKWKMIHFAARFDVCSVIDCILQLDQNYNLNIPDSDKLTPLHIAVEFGNVEFVKKLVNKKEVLLKFKDYKNRTPFDIACVHGHLEIVKCYFEKGIAENTVNKNNETLLHSACKSDRLEIVKYLVGMNVDLNVANNEGKTPFHIACIYGHLEIVKYFIEEVDLDRYDFLDKEGLKGIQLACECGKLEILKYLAEKRVSLRAVNKNGDSLLHLACKGHSLEVVKYLVDKKLPLYAVNKNKETILHIMAASENFEGSGILEFLLEKNVPLDNVDKDGRTALHIAVINRNISVDKLLREENIDVSKKDTYGKIADDYLDYDTDNSDDYENIDVSIKDNCGTIANDDMSDADNPDPDDLYGSDNSDDDDYSD